MKLIRTLLPLVLSIGVSTVHAGPLSWLLGPDNYWECILDNMPGTLTYGGSMEVIAKCSQEFPDKTQYELARPWIFKPKNFDECLEKYREGNKEPLAQQTIFQACYFLYPPP